MEGVGSTTGTGEEIRKLRGWQELVRGGSAMAISLGIVAGIAVCNRIAFASWTRVLWQSLTTASYVYSRETSGLQSGPINRLFLGAHGPVPACFSRENQPLFSRRRR